MSETIAALREQFEKLHPVPEDIKWSEALKHYDTNREWAAWAYHDYNAKWKDFQISHGLAPEALDSQGSDTGNYIIQLESKLASSNRYIEMLEEDRYQMLTRERKNYMTLGDMLRGLLIGLVIIFCYTLLLWAGGGVVMAPFAMLCVYFLGIIYGVGFTKAD